METFGVDSSGWPVPPGSQSSHFARHGPSRRAFIGGAAAAAAGASLGSVLVWPAAASAGSFSVAPPRPTPATTTVNGVAFHFVDPFHAGVDPSSITDFKGLVGVADVQGTGTGRNPDGSTETLLFDTDMRFMQGTYVGLDGAVHEATFGFV